MMAPQDDGESNGVNLINLAEMPMESFTIDEVKIHWRRVAHQMKSLGKETVYNALIKRDPIITEDTNFTLELDNEVQIELIKTCVDDIITYLRSSLKNYGIQLIMRINNSESAVEVKHLNGNDRYKYLSKKYPYLARMKEIFGLEVEY